MSADKYNTDRLAQLIYNAYQDLSYTQLKELKRFLQEQAVIRSATIRQIIQNQGDNDNKGYFIIQGTVTITKYLPSKSYKSNSINLSELSYPQIINIEQLYYQDEKVHYTSTVNSSKAILIQLPNEYLQMFYKLIQKPIKELEIFRSKQIANKQKIDIIKQKQSQKQEIISKLSLPQLKVNFGKVHKLKIPKAFQKNIRQNKNNELQMTDFNRFKSKSLGRLPKNIRSEGQHSQKNNKQQIDRNEKIFREQLKTIIRRKLIYERKQFGVLKNYRRQQQNHDQIIYNQQKQRKNEKKHVHRAPEKQATQIDSYFMY